MPWQNSRTCWRLRRLQITVIQWRSESDRNPNNFDNVFRTINFKTANPNPKPTFRINAKSVL
jgi:hypothetical protein